MSGLLRWAAIMIAAGLVFVSAGCGPDRDDESLFVSNVQANEAMSDARQTLYRHAQSSDGEARTRALETLGMMVGPEAGAVLAENLDHPAVAVRFAAAMGVGDCRYTPALPKLRAMLAAETTDPSVQCAAIYALHRMGDDSCTHRLAAVLYDGTPEARANAALVMAKLGVPAAERPLADRLKTEKDQRVVLQIAESLAALRHRSSYGILAAKAWIGEPHEQMLAVQALGRTRTEQARGALMQAFDPERPPPIRLAAAAGLAKLGDRRGLGISLQAIRDPQKFARESFGQPVTLNDAQVGQYKTLASLALGEMGLPGAVDVLLPLLSDPDPTVAIAAAKAILNLLSPGVPAAQPALTVPAPLPATTQAAPPPSEPGAILRTAPPQE